MQAIYAAADLAEAVAAARKLNKWEPIGTLLASAASHAEAADIGTVELRLEQALEHACLVGDDKLAAAISAARATAMESAE